MRMKDRISSGDAPRVCRNIEILESPKVIGVVNVEEITTQHGKVISCRHICKHNLVVDSGRNNLARLLGGDSTKYIAYLALGDSKVNVPALADTLLESEVKRITYTPGTDKSYPSTGSVLFSRTVAGDEFVSTTVIREGGLFLSDGSSAVNTGTMFNRVIFVDDNPGVGLTNAGLIFQPTNSSGVAIGNKIEFEILF